MRVTYGFVAVECDAGVNEIEFDYSTPGLVVSSKVSFAGIEMSLPGGVWISLIALAVYVLYMLYYKLIKKHKAETKFFGFEFYDDCGAADVVKKKKGESEKEVCAVNIAVATDEELPLERESSEAESASEAICNEISESESEADCGDVEERPDEQQ